MRGLSKRYEISHAELAALRFASSPEVLPFFDIVLLYSKKILCIGNMEEKIIPPAAKIWQFPMHGTSHVVNRYHLLSIN